MVDRSNKQNIIAHACWLRSQVGLLGSVTSKRIIIKIGNYIHNVSSTKCLGISISRRRVFLFPYCVSSSFSHSTLRGSFYIHMCVESTSSQQPNTPSFLLIKRCVFVHLMNITEKIFCFIKYDDDDRNAAYNYIFFIRCLMWSLMECNLTWYLLPFLWIPLTFFSKLLYFSPKIFFLFRHCPPKLYSVSPYACVFMYCSKSCAIYYNRVKSQW